MKRTIDFCRRLPILAVGILIALIADAAFAHMAQAALAAIPSTLEQLGRQWVGKN